MLLSAKKNLNGKCSFMLYNTLYFYLLSAHGLDALVLYPRQLPNSLLSIFYDSWARIRRIFLDQVILC